MFTLVNDYENKYLILVNNVYNPIPLYIFLVIVAGMTIGCILLMIFGSIKDTKDYNEIKHQVTGFAGLMQDKTKSKVKKVKEIQDIDFNMSNKITGALFSNKEEKKVKKLGEHD